MPRINGAAGADTIVGTSGDDTITGFAGNDMIDGSAETAIAIFSGDSSLYTLTAGADGVLIVTGLMEPTACPTSKRCRWGAPI
jgi:Ca2+-binding RTX toxin-like protein